METEGDIRGLCATVVEGTLTRTNRRGGAEREGVPGTYGVVLGLRTRKGLVLQSLRPLRTKNHIACPCPNFTLRTQSFYPLVVVFFCQIGSKEKLCCIMSNFQFDKNRR